jgi:hypothetical protein
VRQIEDIVRALPEVETTARACEAAGDVVRWAFAVDTQHQPGFTIFLLGNAAESDLVLDKLPGIEPGYRQFLKNVVGAKIPAQPYIVYWDKDVKKRIDGSVRQMIGDFLGRGFGIGFDAGWAWEGFGLYLTRELVGTRLTWFIQPDSGTKPDLLKARLLKPDANWINEAWELLKTPERPPFAAALDRELNAMKVPDVLYAYALAAYLIEAAKRMRERRHHFERRLERWLSERH